MTDEERKAWEELVDAANKGCVMASEDGRIGILAAFRELQAWREAGDGAARIVAERIRQKSVEGWTPEHDAQHSKGELTIAATCYALNKMPVYADHWFDEMSEWWPWHPDWDKRDKHDRKRSLEIAGALIAAELDRIEAVEKAREGK